MSVLSSNIENPVVFANVHTTDQDPVGSMQPSSDLPCVSNKLIAAIVNNHDLISPVNVSNVKQIFKANTLYRARYAPYFGNNNRVYESISMRVCADTADDTTYRYYTVPNAGIPQGWEDPDSYSDIKNYKCTQVALLGKSVVGDFAKYKPFNVVTTEPMGSTCKVGASLIVKLNKTALKDVPFKIGIKCSRDVINISSSTETNTVIQSDGGHCCYYFGSTSQFVELGSGSSLEDSNLVKKLADNVYMINAVNANATVPHLSHTGGQYSKFAMLPTPIIKFYTTTANIPSDGTWYHPGTGLNNLPYWNVDWLYAFDV